MAHNQSFRNSVGPQNNAEEVFCGDAKTAAREFVYRPATGARLATTLQATTLQATTGHTISFGLRYVFDQEIFQQPFETQVSPS